MYLFEVSSFRPNKVMWGGKPRDTNSQEQLFQSILGRDAETSSGEAKDRPIQHGPELVSSRARVVPEKKVTLRKKVRRKPGQGTSFLRTFSSNVRGLQEKKQNLLWSKTRAR